MLEIGRLINCCCEVIKGLSVVDEITKILCKKQAGHRVLKLRISNAGQSLTYCVLDKLGYAFYAQFFH
jgi:hypothetical protein